MFGGRRFALSHLPGCAWLPAGIGTFPATRTSVSRDGCRGFTGPVPPPLSMRTAMSAAQDTGGRLRIPPMPLATMTDEPRSPHAEPAQATLAARTGTDLRGRRPA